MEARTAWKYHQRAHSLVLSLFITEILRKRLEKKHTDFTPVFSLLMFNKRVFKLINLILIKISVSKFRGFLSQFKGRG